MSTVHFSDVLMVFKNPPFQNNTNEWPEWRQQLIVKAINNCSACSILFLSTTGLLPACTKILKHVTQSSAPTFFLSAGDNPGVGSKTVKK